MQYKHDNSGKCTFCDKETETIMHLLIECDYVKIFSEQMLGAIKEIIPWYPLQERYEPIENILNKIDNDERHVINFIFLAAKFHIYRSRCARNKPSIVTFKREIENYRNTEKYNVTKNNTIEKHMRKWHNVRIARSDYVIRYQVFNDYIDNMDL